MYTPDRSFKLIMEKVGEVGGTAFCSTLLVGILVHMPILVSDIPNHDGLASMYFDQNMLTSGRWFLQFACGISSYYSLPWLTGILAIFYLAITAIILCKLLCINSKIIAVLISFLLVSFPSVASDFAYVFTMDGYMLGVLFSVLAVYLANLFKRGYLLGALFLAMSLGIYQGYLPITVLLSVVCLYYKIIADEDFKNQFSAIKNYILMGVLGSGIYFVILKLLLVIKDQSLNTYQGINAIGSAEKIGLLYSLKNIYFDFFSFSVRGHILFANKYAFIATSLLLISFCFVFVNFIFSTRKKILAVVGAAVIVIGLPLILNLILFVSPNVTYHLLMRYQWVFVEIVMIAFIEKKLPDFKTSEVPIILQWCVLISTFVIGFSYCISDNIAYSNMQKKYEKTYGYCLRLADRIEQTDGYYEGIPIYLIGVIANEQYPLTDITSPVTGGIIGASGDYLLYSSDNFSAFFKHYLGISFNFVDLEKYNYYYEDWYIGMPSFPAKESICIKDGVLIVKTENVNR